MPEAKQKPEDVEDRAVYMLPFVILSVYVMAGYPGLPEFDQDDYEAHAEITANENYKFCDTFGFDQNYC